MRTHGYVIVEVDESYINEVEVAGGLKLTVNTTIESIEHINRKARIISAPAFTPLKEGDYIIMHHNICRLRNGVKGELIRSNYHLKENQYFVPLTEIFMYKRPDEYWEALAPFVFVKPIVHEGIKSSLHIIDSTAAHNGMVRNIGYIKYGNKLLDDYGFVKGDKILFSNDSEYEFCIEGELLYKMSFKDILGKFE